MSRAHIADTWYDLVRRKFEEVILLIRKQRVQKRRKKHIVGIATDRPRPCDKTNTLSPTNDRTKLILIFNQK